LPALDDSEDPPAALAQILVAASVRTLDESLEDHMKALPILETDLHAELTAQSTQERQARIEVLKRMGQLELHRTNNAARSKAELALIKVQGGATRVSWG
jgi:hypothetical protein